MRRQITYTPGRDYYSILGVASNASEDELRVAYRQRVRETHPDLHPNNQAWATRQLQQINEAYAVLSDPLERVLYDQMRYHYSRFRRKRPPSGARSARQRPPNTPYRRYATDRSPPRSHTDTYSKQGPTRYKARYTAQSSPKPSKKRRYYTRVHTHARPRPTPDEMERARRLDQLRQRVALSLFIVWVLAVCGFCYSSLFLGWP